MENRVNWYVGKDRIGKSRHTILAAMTALALQPVHNADAQMVHGLRGEVEDSQTAETLLGRKPLEDQSTALLQSERDKQEQQARKDAAQQPYIPQSEGALPDEEGGPLGGNQLEAPRLPMGAGERAETVFTRDNDGQNGLAELPPGENEPQDILTGTIRTAPQQTEDEERNRAAQRSNLPVTPIESIDRTAEENPYEPLGIRFGPLRLTSTLESGLTYTDNALSSTIKQSGLLSETTLRLNAVTDWPVNSAEINAFATWRQALSGPGENEPALGIDGTFNYEIGRDHLVTASGGYEMRREAAESPVPIPAGATRPLLHRLNASLALARTQGALRYSMTGRIDRDAYGDVNTSGGTLSQKDRNFTLATAKLRLGYAVSPAFTPFMEVEYGRRIRDNKLDAAGYARSADRYAIRGGVSIDLGEKLTGDIAAGYIRESLDDARLTDIDGISLLASLNWSPQRDTTIGMNAETTVEGATVAGNSGSIQHSARLTLDRRIRTNFTVNAELFAALRDYRGTGGQDFTMAGQLGFTWWLNRNVGISTRYRHERQTSSLPGRDYNINSGFIGLKLQR